MSYIRGIRSFVLAILMAFPLFSKASSHSCNTIEHTVIEVNDSLGETTGALPFHVVLKWVLTHHPVLKQANNYLPIAKADLLATRGAFDPSFSIYRSQKGTEGSYKFYQNQNLDVYIPNYYGGGITIINPFSRNSVSETGNLSLTAELPLLKGLITDYRRTALGKAHIGVEMSLAQRDQWINDLVLDIFTEYAQWLVAHESAKQIEGVLRLATERQKGLRKLFASGAGTSVDTMETFVQWQQYKVKYDLAIWKKEKQRLMVSMYLWDGNGNPIEPLPTVYPSNDGLAWIDSMVIEAKNYTDMGGANPVLQPSLRLSQLKVESQRLEFNLAKNMMLPSLNLQYGYSQPSRDWRYTPATATQFSGFGLGFQSSLFFKQQRGQYRSLQLSLANAELEVSNKQRNYQVKSGALYQEFNVQRSQYDQWLSVSKNQRKLYEMESKRLEAGDVNFFILNSREMRLLDLNLMALDYQLQYQLSGIAFLHYLGWLSRG